MSRAKGVTHPTVFLLMINFAGPPGSDASLVTAGACLRLWPASTLSLSTLMPAKVVVLFDLVRDTL